MVDGNFREFSESVSESNYFDPDLDLEDDEDEGEENVTMRIFNEEINPDMPTEDIENNLGYLFLYYLPNRRGELIFNNIPETWERWATTFADLYNPRLRETQFVGDLGDRELVENLLRNQLEDYIRTGVIEDYRIRRNYIRGYA